AVGVARQRTDRDGEAQHRSHGFSDEVVSAAVRAARDQGYDTRDRSKRCATACGEATRTSTAITLRPSTSSEGSRWVREGSDAQPARAEWLAGVPSDSAACRGRRLRWTWRPLR